MAKKKNTPRKETAQKKIKKSNPTPLKSKSKNQKKTPVKNQKFYDQLKLHDSYVSLILGAVVVLCAFAIFAVFLIEARDTSPKPAVLNTSITPKVTKAPQKTYTVLENETLWDIAVREYGDGFRYVEIIEANQLENPDYVPPGTVIIIPNTQ